MKSGRTEAGGFFFGGANDNEYHAARNKFERFRVFWELASRFEFDFRRCGFFYKRFDFFGVFKFSITHSVACFCPHNSFSNVVVFLTIHDIAKIFIGDVYKKHETIVEGRANRSLYLGFGGERRIEPSGGWFLPQCSSGELALSNFIR